MHGKGPGQTAKDKSPGKTYRNLKRLVTRAVFRGNLATEEDLRPF